MYEKNNTPAIYSKKQHFREFIGTKNGIETQKTPFVWNEIFLQMILMGKGKRHSGDLFPAMPLYLRRERDSNP